MIGFDELRARALLLGYRQLVRPWLFSSNQGNPEAIHEQMLRVLGDLPESLLDLCAETIGVRRNPVTVAGIRFPGRVGLAAGLDKDARAAKAWSSLGFGFAELGTVTAHPQPGNKKPRLFRLVHSEAVINRMGFNNQGVEAMARRLAGFGVVRGTDTLGMPIGVSIGKTKVTPLAQAVDDYLFSFETIAPYADYVAINVSSPNTPGLRALQDHDMLAELLKALVGAAKNLAGPPLPLFVKVAPDLNPGGLDDIIEVCLDAGINGIIATNTTLRRDNIHPLDADYKSQVGGLSGAPLTKMSAEMISYIANQTDLPVIASGGIMTPHDAQAVFDAGAKLVQVYTGFIFNGPALITGINTLTKPEV